MDATMRLLAGRYELREVIGRGGMSTVYRAHDRVLGRAVAVKLLAPALADGDATNVARFEREARAAAALNHRSVVAIYDTGADDGSRYIVMEYLDGRTLADVLRADAPLAPQRATRIAADVADALAAAHAAGIVHRDIKPSNVMVADDGTVKVLDFGIARALAGTSITRTSAVLGTAAYMSPEQALGKPVDERSDIYSLGCLLYALLAGRAPFRGDADAALLHQHATAEPRPLRSANAAVSAELEALVSELMAKSPQRRTQTAAGARDRLLALAGAPADSPTAPTRVLPGPRGRGRTARRVAALAALLAGALVAVVIALASSGGSTGGSAARSSSGQARAAAGTKSTASRPAQVSTTASSPSQTEPSTSTAATLESALAATSALVAQGVQSGAIDANAAGQIEQALAHVRSGDDAQHQVLALAQHLPKLVQQGHITPTAASALQASLGTLAAALGGELQAAPASGTEATPPAKHGGGHGRGHGKDKGD